MTNILAILRAERFSPNSVDKDKAIMDAVCQRLGSCGAHIRMISEEQLTAGIKTDIILTMGRMKATNAILKQYEAIGIPVINSPKGIEACKRNVIDGIMRNNGIPTAPRNGSGAMWIKRCDEAAQSKNDIIFARNKAEAEQAVRAFEQRGVTELLITDHVEGDLIKFYGVVGTGFFKTFYPTDDGISKFGDETYNGSSHHYEFDKNRMQQDAEKAASTAGVCVYGGDCIVRQDSSYAIIDFNDWPSFSRCRAEAAEAIEKAVTKLSL